MSRNNIVTEYAAISPREGFDWRRVLWGGPHDPVTETCSYCRRALEEDNRDYVALRLWNAAGSAAAFCDDCMRQWWGMEQL